MESTAIHLENQEFEGDNTVYLLESEGETALVDTGVATDGVRRQLEDAFDAEDVTVEDVDKVFVTHWHADHSGLAGWMQRRSGCDVLVHSDDAALVRQSEDAWDEMRDIRDSLLESWGMPAAPKEELVGFLEGWAAILDEPPEVTEIADGDMVEVGDASVKALQTPGHTLGHMCFAVDEVLYSGDALLPVYTPNVGGADVRVPEPLDRYVDSLRRIDARGFDFAYPGHRDAIAEPSARAREIVDHHRERARRVLDVVDRLAGSTAWEVGAELFGELSGIHIMHGPGESYAHLDHLVREELVTAVGEAPVRYEIAVDVEDALESVDRSLSH